MVILFFGWCSLHFRAVSWCQITMGKVSILDWRSNKSWLILCQQRVRETDIAIDIATTSIATLVWELLKGWWLRSIILLRQVTTFLALIILPLFSSKINLVKFNLLPAYERTLKLWLSQINLKRTAIAFILEGSMWHMNWKMLLYHFPPMMRYIGSLGWETLMRQAATKDRWSSYFALSESMAFHWWLQDYQVHILGYSKRERLSKELEVARNHYRGIVILWKEALTSIFFAPFWLQLSNRISYFTMWLEL